MKIDWSEAKDKEVFGLAKATRFREMKKIHFEYIKKEESKEVLEYLLSNCPHKLKIFAFEANTGYGMFGLSIYYGNGDFYVKGIEKVSV